MPILKFISPETHAHTDPHRHNDRIVPRDDGPSLNAWDDGRFSANCVTSSILP